MLINQNQFAGLFRRTISFLIDTFVCLAIWASCLMLFIVLAVKLEVTPPESFSSPIPPVEFQMVIGFASIVAFFINFLYFTLMESSRFHATLGKLCLRIKVTDEDGHRINFLRSAGRNYCKSITIATMGLGFFLLPLTKNKQAIHDKMSGCIVVKNSFAIIQKD